MIQIHSTDLIGKGLHRECFSHPQDNSLCVKIAVNENITETRREQSYYRLLESRKVSWAMLPKFHGNIDTNMGSGAVFDMIRNPDGAVSKTLEFYLRSIEESRRHYSDLLSAFVALKDYLLKEQIITMTIKPKNIVYQESGEERGKLFIVDNIGNSDYLPLCNYSKMFGSKKIRRKWQRFENSILKTYPENDAFKEIIDHTKGK